MTLPSMEYASRILVAGRTLLQTPSANRESIQLQKQLMKHGYQIKILPINTENIEYPIPANHQVFAINLHCENSSSLIEKLLFGAPIIYWRSVYETSSLKASELKFFASPFRWILYHENLSPNYISEEYLSVADILVDSDVILCQPEENGTISLKKIYKLRRNYTIEIEEMGHWTTATGVVDQKFEKNTAKRRRNLMGTQLNNCIVITNNDSLNHLTDKRDKHIDSIEKVNYVLVEHLKDIINATYKYSIQATWGYKEKSKWTGMIGELMREEADIGGTPLFFTVDRVDIIDYIAMTTPTKSKFVFRQPKLSYVTNVFTLPFDTNVWVSTICLVILVGLVLYVTTKWEWLKNTKYEKRQVRPDGSELQDSMIDVALVSFGAFCQQGATAIPVSIPGRIATLVLFVSLMFLYTSYSANIVALLQSSSTSIQTLEDLLKSRLQIGVDDTVFNRFYFPNATEPVRRALYMQKVVPAGKKENFMPIEVGVRRMRKGLFAFHMETGPGYKIVSEVFQEAEKCGLQEIQFLQVIDPFLAVQKNTSYKELFKIGLRKIQETGLQAREVALIYTKKPMCISRGSSFISVGIVDCYPAALVLAGGLIVSFAIWILEVYVHYRTNFYKNRKIGGFPSPSVELKTVDGDDEGRRYPFPYLK